MRRVKLAYIGGGSLFVPSIINGIGQVIAQAAERFEVELSLYDIDVAKVQRPQPVGEVPDWLGGYTRLLAVQRCLIVEYVLGRRLETLKQALATLPMFGTVQQLNAYADALHEEYTVGASDAH